MLTVATAIPRMMTTMSRTRQRSRASPTGNSRAMCKVVQALYQSSITITPTPFPTNDDRHEIRSPRHTSPFAWSFHYLAFAVFLFCGITMEFGVSVHTTAMLRFEIRWNSAQTQLLRDSKYLGPHGFAICSKCNIKITRSCYFSTTLFIRLRFELQETLLLHESVVMWKG
jgi:hypothetical protein